MQTTFRQTFRNRRRRAVLSLELVLVLPVLLLVLLAIFQMSTYLLATQAIQAAALAGAREATLPGASAEGIEHSVHRALGGWRFRDDVDVTIRPDDWASLPSGEGVSVTVRVDADKAAINSLAILPGLSLEGKDITGQYVMRKE
ncbi:MAG: pilus assembly protein [Pirellulales bacterium]|nr:pilus assembly protein [Pirellulales bacterium]